LTTLICFGSAYFFGENNPYIFISVLLGEFCGGLNSLGYFIMEAGEEIEFATSCSCGFSSVIEPLLF
jgi:hypothetical protein